MKRKRKPIKRVSDRQAARNRIWAKVKRDYLKGRLRCERCQKWTNKLDVHHSRGKNGSLRYDTRFFIAVCRPCHTWIDNNRAEARKLGLLCDYGLFNQPPKDNG